MADQRGKVKKMASDRTALVNSLLGKMDKQVEAAQRDLLRVVLNDFLDGMEQDEAGNIKNTLANKRRFASFETIFARFAKDRGLSVVQSIAEGTNKLVNFNHKYFSPFATKVTLAPIQENVKETLNAWLGITTRGSVQPNGYLDALIKDATIKNQIKNLTLKAVISQAGYFDTKKALETFIQGDSEKVGALQKYYRNYAYDTFSVADRTAGKIYADKLRLNYAIYEGGIVEASREFCRKRNGKVFSREEIAEFDPQEARQPGYDPFTDLGGYGCRHHLNWIPDAVAFALRPDLRSPAE
jgi:hypothetical protein